MKYCGWASEILHQLVVQKKITGPSTVALEHGPFMDDYDESSIIFNGGFPVC